eukprot:6262762-Pyramimonas_sp.AAC.2
MAEESSGTPSKFGRVASRRRMSAMNRVKPLTNVDLSGNPLGHTGAKELSLALSRNETLVSAACRASVRVGQVCVSGKCACRA